MKTSTITTRSEGPSKFSYTGPGKKPSRDLDETDPIIPDEDEEDEDFELPIDDDMEDFNEFDVDDDDDDF